MQSKHRRPFNKILWAMVLVVLAGTLASGFYGRLSAGSEETYRGLKLFADVIELIENNYVDSVDSEELIRHAIEGMVEHLDPHSSLLKPEDFEELQVDTQGEFTGIGISITMRDGFVTVISPIDGTPAYRAGIQAGDRITAIDGETTRDLRDAVNRMRGPKGTEVVVSIQRTGVEEAIHFSLIRDVIPIESVKAVQLDPGYGYVWVTNFNVNTAQDLEKALNHLESGDEPLRGLILDLRNNPGGLLPQAIDVSDFFLEGGKILSIVGRRKENQKVFEARASKKPRTYPMVVLINGGSASASEIVAGALQDHKRALILGTPSFGKGSVQTVEALRSGYGIKLTIARYYTPSGRSIQAKGIVPDIFVKYELLEKNAHSSGEEGLLKERDLQNHLQAEPDKTTAADPSPQEGQPDTATQTEMLPGQVDRQHLQTDNQVMRALEILIGFDIFSQVDR